MSLDRIGRTSISSNYEIVNQAGELTANAKTVIVVYDYATAQPVPVSETIRARLVAS